MYEFYTFGLNNYLSFSLVSKWCANYK